MEVQYALDYVTSSQGYLHIYFGGGAYFQRLCYGNMGTFEWGRKVKSNLIEFSHLYLKLQHLEDGFETLVMNWTVLH